MITFIDDHRMAYGVEPICRVLPIAPSTYRAHVARRIDPARLPPRAKRDLVLAAEIRRVFEANFRVYGVRKVWRQLGREGIAAARCTVARLMRQMGLQGAVRGREVRTTVSNPAVACPLDRVNRQFRAPRPNVLWLSDFTYVATWQGFVYVAFVIDAYARRIVGWRVSRTAHAGFVLDALEQALADRRAGRRPRAPQRQGGAIRLHPLHRASRRGWHRALGRKRRRQLRQRFGGEHQRPLQDRGDPQMRTVALARSRRVRHAGMGRVVQQPPPARAYRKHASR
jgi:hypothetical protein